MYGAVPPETETSNLTIVPGGTVVADCVTVAVNGAAAVAAGMNIGIAVIKSPTINRATDAAVVILRIFHFLLFIWLLLVQRVLIKVIRAIIRILYGTSIYKGGGIVSAHSQHTMLSHSLRAFCEQVLGYS